MKFNVPPIVTRANSVSDSILRLLFSSVPERFRGSREGYLYQRRRPLLPPLLPNLHLGPNILSSAGRNVGRDALMIPRRGTMAAMSANGANVYVISVGSSSSMYLIRAHVMAMILDTVSIIDRYF